ncbi:MAG: rhomboid family intramembrane serine protease [Candidatus Brocadiia bacterium]|nr:MAG: rhomboid family intramembrane serine protease [Candidatus Brocadiia bacterium]
MSGKQLRLPKKRRSIVIIPWRVDVPQERYSYMNWLICAGLIVFFILQVSVGIEENIDSEPDAEIVSLTKQRQGKPDMSDEEFTKLVNERLLERQKRSKVWPYVLSGFTLKGLFGHMWLHGGIVHLLGNMLFLWVFGNAVSAKIGNIIYLPIYLFVGIAAAVSHLLFVGGSMIGASGAIYGIVGMYLVFFYENDITCYFTFTFLYWKEFTVSSIWIILYFLVFDILGAVLNLTGTQLGVAYFAHLGGFAAGFLIAIVMLKTGMVKMERYEKSLLQAWADKRNPPEEDLSGYGSFARELREDNTRTESSSVLEQKKPLPEPIRLPDFPLPSSPPIRANELNTKGDCTELIRFVCSCGKNIKVPKKFAGKKGKCPRCQNKILIPFE